MTIDNVGIPFMYAAIETSELNDVHRTNDPPRPANVPRRIWALVGGDQAASRPRERIHAYVFTKCWNIGRLLHAE